MAIWLFRAGKSGEYESKFLNDKRIYLTWDGLDTDLSKFADRKKLLGYLVDLYPDAKRNTVINWLGQVYSIAHRIKNEDWIILPSKKQNVIHIGKVIGKYEYHKNAQDPFFHSRKVDWFATGIYFHILLIFLL